MHRIEIIVPVYLPDWVYRMLRALTHKFKSPCHGVSLLGDRDIEWSWIASQMPSGEGKALDFGCGNGYLALIAARLGFDVTAIDLQPVRLSYVNPRLHLLRGSIFKLSLSKKYFDLVINCSTVEHVGLAGRYGVTKNRPEGDLEAMTLLNELMKPGGVMLLTIPVGRDTVFPPLHRVYGKKRLPRLINGYIVEKEEFWIKDKENRYVPCDKETALNFEPSWSVMKKAYALGLFVLRKPEN